MWGSGIVCLVLVLLALMTWAQRTRWRTFTLPADPKTGLAVAIDYPEDWTIDPQYIQPEGDRFQSVRFSPLKPNSLVRWCREHLLGHREAKTLSATIRFTLYPAVTTGTIDEMEAAIHARRYGRTIDRVQVKRCRLPSGPALDTRLSLTLPVSNGIRQHGKAHQCMIFLASQNRDLRMTLEANYFMPEDDAALDRRFQQAVDRVHFVHISKTNR